MQENQFNNKHILVTGGAGFIGHHLVKRIMADNPSHLYIIDNLSSGNLDNIRSYIDSPNFTLINSDIANSESTSSIKKLDFIIHLAAIVSVPKSFETPFLTHRTNESGFVNILELSKKLGVKKIVYASSSAIYGEQNVIPIPENAIPNPMSPYGLSKLLNEQYANSFYSWENISSIGLRFFNVYGPGQKADSPYSGVISIFTEKMLAQEDIFIFGDGQQTRDFIYVEDVIQAILLSISSDIQYGIYNVGTQDSIDLNQLFNIMSPILGYKSAPIYKQERKGDIQKSVANIGKIRSDFNFEPKYDLVKGINHLLNN